MFQVARHLLKQLVHSLCGNNNLAPSRSWQSEAMLKRKPSYAIMYAITPPLFICAMIFMLKWKKFLHLENVSSLIASLVIKKIEVKILAEILS